MHKQRRLGKLGRRQSSTVYGVQSNPGSCIVMHTPLLIRISRCLSVPNQLREYIGSLYADQEKLFITIPGSDSFAVACFRCPMSRPNPDHPSRLAHEQNVASAAIAIRHVNLRRTDINRRETRTVAE